jgi:DNA-binding transcriptional regulator YhcF (GntR family)
MAIPSHNPSPRSSAQGEKSTTPLHYRLTNEEWLTVSQELRYAELKLLYYLRTLDPEDTLTLKLSVRKTADLLQCKPGTISRAIRVLAAKNYINPSRYFNLQEQTAPEQKVRDRLQRVLGGLTEVATPLGRVDLLTDTEIIEVKCLEDWKSALGQILVYASFYPEHQKRIHLFGQINPLKEIEIHRTCEELGVLATFEEVPDA